jgi:hypothetical protein
MHHSVRARFVILCAVALFPGRALAEVTDSTRETPACEAKIDASPRDTKAPVRPLASDAESRRAAREALKREIASFGMVALVRASLDASPLAASPFHDASPAPVTSADAAHAQMWRGVIEDAVGAGDLRLSSTGDGVPPIVAASGNVVRTVGGGNGIDDVDTFAHRERQESHVTTAPERRDQSDGTGRVTVGERIQRIIRGNFGPFDACYERGLHDDPSLKGRVAVKVTIDGTGAVTTAVDAGSDLPDAAVVSCVVRSFATLAFPATGREITVVYPLTLRPAERGARE